MNHLLLSLYLALISLCFFSCEKKVSQKGEKALYQASPPISHLDPQLATGLASSIQLSKVYESLIEIHPFHRPYKVLPNLAEKVPVISLNGRTITAKIKKGVLYHPCKCFNGKKRAVKASDFITTFQRIADPRLASPHFNRWAKIIVGLKEWHDKQKKQEKIDYSVPIKGLRALDEHTLQIKIKNPNPYILHEMSIPALAPLPLEALLYFDNDLSEEVIGTGPFKLVKYIKKKRIEYRRNSEYREKKFPTKGSPQFSDYMKEYGGQKVPFLDKIIVKIIDESKAQWESFTKGEIDFVEIPKEYYRRSVTSHNELSKEMKEKGMGLRITKSDSNVYYFGMNNKNEFLKNVHLRRAIAYAYDHDGYNDLIFNGTAVVANSPLPPGIPGNKRPLKSPYIGVNIEKAKLELKKAGYPEGEGLPEISITIRNSRLAGEVAEHFKESMSKIGIKVKIDAVSWPSLLEKAQRGDYMMFYLAWFVEIPTGEQFFQILYGPNWPESYNRMGFQNKEFDELYEQAQKVSSAKQQNTIFRLMNEVAVDQVPILPLAHARDFFVKQGWLKNYVPSETAGGTEQYLDVDMSLKSKLLKKF